MPDSKNPLDAFRTSGGDDWFSKFESEESKFASKSVQDATAQKPIIAPSLRMPSHGDSSGKVTYSGPRVGSWGEELPPSNAPIDLAEKEEPKADAFGSPIPTPEELVSSENMATHTKEGYETGPSGKPTKAEEYAIRGGVADKINTAFDKSYAPDFVKDAHRAIIDTIAPGIESSIAALVGSTGKPLGVVDRVLANMLAKRFNVPDYAKKFSEEHNVNSITAGYNARTDVMKVSGGRTDDIKKLKPEEREALRSGTLDNILGKIERATTTEDSWGEKTSYVAIDPGAADRWGAEAGPAMVGSLPLMAAGAAVGGAIGSAAAGSKAVAGVANFITKSPVLAPFLRKIGIASAEEATTVMANLIGAQAGSSVEALGEAGAVYDKLVSEGMDESQAAEQASKVFVANQLLLGFTNNAGPTAKVVKGLISAGRSAEAEAIARTALANAYKERALKVGQAAILKDEAKTAVKRTVKPAGEAIWEATKDAFTEGFLEEQGQKVVSDLAEQGKPFTWDNIVDTYIKNWDEGVLGGVLGVAMGGGSKALNSRDVAGYEKKIADFKARNKEYVPMASRSGAEFSNSKPVASTTPAATTVTGTNAQTTSPKSTKAQVAKPTTKTGVTVQPAFTASTPTVTSAASEPVVKNAITINPATVLLTSSYGEAGKPESITTHTHDTSHTVANRGVAQSMFSLLAGAIKERGDEIDDAAKAKIHNITNALSAPGAITKVVGALKAEGMPEPVLEALTATQAALKAQGLDVNRSTLTKEGKPIPASEAADRSWRFLNELHTQLAPRVQAMGVDAPSWLRETVAKMGKIVAPGSKYDTAFRMGMGLDLREAEQEHVPVAPIAPIIKTEEKANAGTRGELRAQLAEEPVTRAAGVGDRTGPAVSEKVERANDPQPLEELGRASQVERKELPERAVKVGPYLMTPAVEGRVVEFYGPSEGPGVMRPHVSIRVMPDGDLFVESAQAKNAKGLGFAKQLYAEAARIAMEHFPEVNASTSMLLGSSTADAQKSRNSYPGTIIGESTVGDPSKPTATPLKSILEYSYVKATEGSTSTEGVQQAPAVDSSQRSEVPQGVGESEVAGTRADEPRGESRPVLGANPEVAGPELTPEQQARLDQLRALLEDDLGTGDVRTLHDEMVEDASKYSSPTESKDGFGAPRIGQLYGHNGLLYPAQAELPGSPYKRVLNLTPNNYLNPEFAKAMGLSWKLSDSLPLPGSALLALLTRNEDGWNKYRKLLAAVGFDAVAYEDSPGNIVITGINDAPDPEVATPNTRKADLTPGSLPKFDKTTGLWSTGSTLRSAPMRVGPKAWGRKSDGSFGWLRGGPREDGNLGQPAPIKQERLGPESYTQPIADEMERDMAVIEAANLVQNNHFTITELLKLARQAGVPITDTDFQRLMDRDDVETGVADARQLQGLDPIADDSGDRRTFTPGELTHKFVEYIKDGGFADIIYRLSKSPEFLAAIGTPGKLAQYGENQYLSVARALATNGSIQEALGLTGKGSGSVYRTTRAMLNSAVDGLLQDPPKYSGALARAMADPKMWQVHSKLMALAAVAAAQYIPDFFYVSSKRLDEMRKKEMEDGAYEDVPKVPVLSNHMELVQEHHGSFAPTIDAKTDRLGANFGSSADPNAATMTRLPYQGAVDSLIQGIAERGGFSSEALAKAGVTPAPKIAHGEAYRAVVDSVEANVDAVMRLEREGVASLLKMPSHLVRSGYAGLMLAYRAGMGKKPFHVDAYRVDPDFTKYYTIGEQTVLQLNAATNDGFPVPEHILTNREMEVMLDRNHPMHDLTVENVIGKLSGSADIILAGTPMRRVVLSYEIPNPKYVAPAYEMRPDDYGDEYRHYTEEGNKEPKMIKVSERSMLVPRNRIHGEYSSVRGITAGVPAQAAAGLSHSGIRVSNPKLVASRLKDALARMGTGDPKWSSALGTDLIDQLATAKTAMENLLVGNVTAKPGVAEDIALLGSVSQENRAKIRQFIVDTENRIKSGNNNAEIAARSRAQEIFSVLERAKSDVMWGDIFNGKNSTGMDITVPVSVAEDCVRNKEQFMKVAEEIMGDNDNNGYTLSVLDKIHPLFFEELGTNISSDPNLHNGSFDHIQRIIKIAGKIKGSMTNSAVGHLMAHELAHALTTFMGVPMQAVADRWFKSEQERFFQKERKASREMGGSGRSRIEDVLGADAIDPITGDTVSVSDVLSERGTMTRPTITPEAREELVAAHPSMEAVLPKTTDDKIGSELYDEDGDLIGYSLDPHFAGYQAYRYLNLAEFIADTMKEALIEHARAISKRPKKDYDTRDRYTYRLNQNGGAKTVMDAVHRNIGRMIDAIVGKNTMRRYVGYLVNNAGLLEHGLKNQSKDVAFPAMDWKGKDDSIFRKGKAGGSPGPISPEDLAKRDYLMMRRIGNWVNIPRAKLMTQLNAASVSDKSRAAAYTMRQVLGDLGLNYNRISQALYAFYDKAHEMTVIDPKTRKWLKSAAENSQNAAKAKQDGFATTVSLMAPDGKAYFVGVDANGKYVDATSYENVKSWTDYELTGKFSGPLAGMEDVVEPVNKMVWGRMSMAIANLADKLAIDADHLADFDQLVEKVKHYYPHQHRSRIEGGFRELMEGGGKATVADAGLGEFNTGLNPAVDYGINAHMLMARTFDNSMEAISNGYFPIHANAVENVMSGAANAMGVIARLDAIAGLLDKSLAVPGYDGAPETQKWGTLKMSTTGLTEEMFGKALADIRLHPDAERTLVYAFKPEPLASTAFGRYMAMISGAMNVFQLWGLNDYVNGMAAVSGFAGQLGFKGSVAKSLLSAGARRGLISGAAAATGMASAAIGTGMAAGVVVGGLTAMGLYTLFNKIRGMSANTRIADSEGRKAMGIATAPDLTKLGKSEIEFRKFLEISNAKLLEGPIQVERMRKMVSELARQGKGAQSAMHYIANALNKPTQWNEQGFGTVGGKATARLGMIKLIAPHIMDKYRDANGNVDFNDPGLRREATQLSDDMDNQVGAIQYRNLHMNPTIVSYMKTIFRAFGFRYTTEKMIALMISDVVNNIGTHMPARENGHWKWSGDTRRYGAFREHATGGGTDRPVRDSGWALRSGTIALGTLMMMTMIASRMQAMMSHVVWPDSNYTQSDFARRTYEQLQGRIGKTPAKAFEGILAVLPPEGSSWGEGIRHVALESFASQAGKSDPTTGRPRHMIPPGAMYARNIYESPLFVTGLKSEGIKIYNWLVSGLNPVITSTYEIARDRDGLNRPLGIGDPFRNVAQVRRMNEWMERNPGDDLFTSAARRIARSAAHLGTSLLPFGARGVNEWASVGEPAGGSWYASVSATLGGRTMPPEASLTEAERIAYEGISYGDKPRTHEQVSRSSAERAAKIEMIETGKTDKLDDLKRRGLLGKDDRSAKKEHSRLKREYLDAPGDPRTNVVRLMRKIMDSSKTTWKDIYIASTPSEKTAIKEYVKSSIGSVKDPTAKKKLEEFNAWINKIGGK